MNSEHTPNERYYERLNKLIEYISKEDEGRIGSYAHPTVLAYNHEEKSLTLRYKFYPEFINCNGVMHGGAACLLLDNSMGYISCAWPEQPQWTPTPSISMNTSFLEPIFPCEHLIVEVKINAVKSKIVYTAATLYDEAQPDKPLVTATGEYYRIDHPVTK